MTQEEFENIVNKTCEISLNCQPEKAAAFWKENGNGDIEIDSDTVWTQVFFKPFDTNLREVERVLPEPNAQCLLWLSLYEELIYEEFPYLICNYSNSDQSLTFATWDLDTIQKMILFEDKNPNDIFLEDIGDRIYESPWYLLINPRKDVVEWALKTFDFKSNSNIKSGLYLIKKCQAIPELKEVILNNLCEKGGKKWKF